MTDDIERSEEYRLGDLVQVSTELGSVDAAVVEYASQSDDHVVVELSHIDTTDLTLSQICDIDQRKISLGSELAIGLVGCDESITGTVKSKIRGERTVAFGRLAAVPKAAVNLEAQQ